MLKEVNAQEFKQECNDGVVFIDFYSKTCGPCKMLSFVLNDVDKTLGDKIKILKVDFDANKELTAEYHVEGYPTMVLLKDGKEVNRKTGLQQKPVIVKMIEEAL